MLRKLFSVVLSAVFLFSSMCTAFAEVPNTAEDKLAAVEKILYGGVLLPPSNRITVSSSMLEEDSSVMQHRG